MNCDPKEDFGGPDSAHHGHADPNLAHARALCDRMCVAKDGAPVEGGDPPSFGAAADGDAVCVAVDAETSVCGRMRADTPIQHGPVHMI